MVNLGPRLQVGNFENWDGGTQPVLRLQKPGPNKPIWLDLEPAEVVALFGFLGTYIQGNNLTPTVTFVEAPDTITEIKLQLS